MSAVLSPTPDNLGPVGTLEAQFEPLTPAWLRHVLLVEQRAYPQPWTVGNFTDSVACWAILWR
jgi:hypothetical protein